jgi:hypothetical protein
MSARFHCVDVIETAGLFFDVVDVADAVFLQRFVTFGSVAERQRVVSRFAVESVGYFLACVHRAIRVCRNHVAFPPNRGAHTYVFVGYAALLRRVFEVSF